MKKHKPKKSWKEPFCMPKETKKKKPLNIKFSQPKLKESIMYEKTITNLQKIEATIGLPVQGIPVWTVESGDSTVIPETDGVKASLVSSNTNGDTTFKVTGMVDRGTGFKEETATIVLHVSDSGEPPVDEPLKITFGEATNK